MKWNKNQQHMHEIVHWSGPTFGECDAWFGQGHSDSGLRFSFQACMTSMNMLSFAQILYHVVAGGWATKPDDFPTSFGWQAFITHIHGSCDLYACIFWAGLVIQAFLGLWLARRDAEHESEPASSAEAAARHPVLGDQFLDRLLIC